MRTRAITVLLLLAALALPAAAETPPPPYESPMREQCDAELARDVKWRARLTAEFTDDKAYAFHEEQMKVFAKHEKHVIWAYAAIWVLTVAFVLDLLRRQQKLKGDLSRLEQQIERAAAADDK